ncbi:sensor histidine kinase [Micromonospora maritima]|uniref:sensor histidine kinase n=1 Tax=Micromonospora maritima TaxID=986711 RepID=UPI00379DA38D
MRLATRLAAACAVTMPVLALAAGAAVLRLAAQDIHREQVAELRAWATELRPAVEDLPAMPPPGNGPLRGAAPGGGMVVEAAGRRWTTGGPPAADLPERDGPVDVRSGWRVWRGYAVSLTVPGAGPGRMWVFAPLGQEERRVRELRRRLLGVALLTVPAGAAVGWLAGRAAARPLTRLGQRLAALGPEPGARERVVVRFGTTEVDAVATLLDSTLDRYDEQVARTAQALAASRSFASAAAHELRTPLAGMAADLEVLQRHPDLPADQRREVLGDVLDAHRRAVAVLAMLRTLAEGELIGPDSFAELDLAELADVEVTAARSRHPTATFTLVAPPSLSYRGFEEGLRCLVTNLLDNAAEHGRTAETGQAAVRVEVSAGVEGVRLIVEDRGPGVPPAHREEIFGRFWRGPGSRGTGLGLALVAQQAALHGGRVEATERPDGPGTRFVVRLPWQGAAR